MFNGIVTAMITPMRDGIIDLMATEKHIEYLIEQKVHGLFILGTNGEFHVLSDEEKFYFAKHVIEYVQGRLPVYVGVGACGTQETIKLAKKMETLNPDALTVITPYLVKLTQTELLQHFKMISETVNAPIILYNIPSNTGINIDPTTLKELASLKNILGIKDSSGSLENIEKYITITKGRDFSVLVGSDSKILDALKLGAKGAVASTTNVIAKHVVTLYEAFLNNDIEKASVLQKEIDVIRGVLKYATIPAVLKRAVSLNYVDVGEARRPVESIGTKFDKEIRDMLAFYKLS